MLSELDAMEREALAELAAVADAAALEAFRVRWLGTNGRLRGAMDGLKTVPKEQKPAVGKRLNEVKASIEGAFDARKDATAMLFPPAMRSAPPVLPRNSFLHHSGVLFSYLATEFLQLFKM